MDHCAFSSIQVSYVSLHKSSPTKTGTRLGLLPYLLALCVCLPLHAQRSKMPQTLPYMNPALPIEQRVDDLIHRMTLEEKVSQMRDYAAAIPRLGIPEYEWWNEGLHGVAFSGYATNFPQVIGMAATWDTDLVHHIAQTISTEARAKYNEAMRENDHERFFGLTFWAPKYQYFSRPTLGTRTGDLRRRPVSHRTHGGRVRYRHAGR
jgi:beta-glucosidase